jgi:hypothetical protein
MAAAVRLDKQQGIALMEAEEIEGDDAMRTVEPA